MSYRQVMGLSVPYTTVRNWSQQSELQEYSGNKKSTNLPGADRSTIIPQPEDLLSFMDYHRYQECALTCSHLVNYLKQKHQTWLREYIARQKEGCRYDNLLKHLQEFCSHHGYTHQQACMAKRAITNLESTRTDFAAHFHNEYGDVQDDCVYNVDEAGIEYDIPPHYIWSRRGGSPKLSKGEKHSYRMTAVLTILRNVHKLPILFIIKGHVDSRIDTHEIPSYPSGHFYTMQDKAWMDANVWEQYLWFVLAERVSGPLILVFETSKPM
ncbi:hypothetical protein B5M09_010597 [Aphanomyces astaci]|uniref:DDE-1 domain-containing protein n=1 Tax=Aphanomyces astaci TaxID=112090 RepID=A0A425CSI7_APHAT|nr:hypothetical protein B5M09_010597 [Aphanomyces astaci]